MYMRYRTYWSDKLVNKLVDCQIFFSRISNDRAQIAAKHRLCFKCLEYEHQSRECRVLQSCVGTSIVLTTNCYIEVSIHKGKRLIHHTVIVLIGALFE